jgi:hypothetical protein
MRAARVVIARLLRGLVFEALLVVAGVLDRLDAPRAAGRTRELAGRVG